MALTAPGLILVFLFLQIHPFDAEYFPCVLPETATTTLSEEDQFSHPLALSLRLFHENPANTVTHSPGATAGCDPRYQNVVLPPTWAAESLAAAREQGSNASGAIHLSSSKDLSDLLAGPRPWFEHFCRDAYNSPLWGGNDISILLNDESNYEDGYFETSEGFQRPRYSNNSGLFHTFSIQDCVADLESQLKVRVLLLCKNAEHNDTKSTIDLITRRDDAFDEDYLLALPRACLGLTTPDIKLRYPEDAESHFFELHQILAPWRSLTYNPGADENKIPKLNPMHIRFNHTWEGYGGPWIENYWVAHFEPLAMASPKLHTIFGGFVPIFLCWTDIWGPNTPNPPAPGLPPDLIAALKRALRSDVPYITVVQHDAGLEIAFSESSLPLPPNILVLSAGGSGHVPIPLLKQPEKPDAIPNIPFQERPHFTSFVGRVGHAPKKLREQMIDAMEELQEEENREIQHYGFNIHRNEKSGTMVTRNASYYHYFGPNWRRVMSESTFSLCPRGLGRTSFHLMETLQLGLVPIQVHLDDTGSADDEDSPYCSDAEHGKKIADEAWVPYELSEYPNVGFTTSISALPILLRRLREITKTSDDTTNTKHSFLNVSAMEERIKMLYLTHFSYEGTLAQIAKFMIGNSPILVPLPKTRCRSKHKGSRRVAVSESDLVCRPLPRRLLSEFVVNSADS